MKQTKTCPKCDGRKLFDIPAVQQTYCDAQGSLRSFDVTGATVFSGKKNMFGGAESEVVVAGPYSAMVCAACGYAEWYASSGALQTLARMAERGAGVRLVDGDAPPKAPFR